MGLRLTVPACLPAHGPTHNQTNQQQPNQPHACTMTLRCTMTLCCTNTQRNTQRNATPLDGRCTSMN
ncbi:uncharacterized protein METZ01_LOCUS349088 [marine metagenome]|uniref:Uncharacterized protein n=1 Tax=marine metagenome TaxID=408172 RepID=A0A382REU5_9ZZZZ